MITNYIMSIFWSNFWIIGQSGQELHAVLCIGSLKKNLLIIQLLPIIQQNKTSPSVIDLYWNCSRLWNRDNGVNAPELHWPTCEYYVSTKKWLAENISRLFTSILGFLASEDTSSAARLTKKVEKWYYFTSSLFGFVPTFQTEMLHLY